MATEGYDMAQTATEWAREHGRHLRGQIARDNYEPTRGFATVDLHTYDMGKDDPRGSGIILADGSQLREAWHAVYLIDDGRTVAPFYVIGWSTDPADPYIMLHPFPVNVHADGSPRLRADDGRPVDFASWALGPRRAYHVKVTPA